MTERALPSRAFRFAPGQAIVKLLRSFGERGAEAVGGAYAELASSVQRRGEQLEDLRAERRYERRSRRVNSPKQPSSTSAQ